MIRERQRDVADDLAFFMPFTSNNECVARHHHRYSGENCFAAVANFSRARCRCHDLRTDLRRHFRTRIIIGDNGHVREARSNFAHDRTLALVAITTTAKHHNHTTRREWTDGSQNIFERFRLMCIIDVSGSTLFRSTNQIKTTRRTFKTLKRAHSSSRRNTCHDCEAC